MARVRERLPRLSPVQRAGRATTSVGCALLFATAIFGAIPLVLLLRNGSAGTEHLVFPIGGLALALSIVAGGVLASRLPAPRFSRLRAHVHARRARAAEPPRNGPPRRARRVRGRRRGRRSTKPSPAKLPTTRTRRLCKSVGCAKRSQVCARSRCRATVSTGGGGSGRSGHTWHVLRRSAVPGDESCTQATTIAAAPPSKRRRGRGEAPRAIGARNGAQAAHEIRGKYPIWRTVPIDAWKRMKVAAVPRRAAVDVATSAAMGPKTSMTPAPTVRPAHAPGITRSRAERRWTHAREYSSSKSATHTASARPVFASSCQPVPGAQTLASHAHQ